MTPQNVTSRYVRNLLNKGANDDYVVNFVERKTHTIDGVLIGQYYDVRIGDKSSHSWQAIGATPAQAVERCLQKYGVTFK